MPRLQGRALRLPGDAPDRLQANKPLSAAPVAKSLPLRPLSHAPAARQTGAGAEEPPAPGRPWSGGLAGFLLGSAEPSTGKPAGLGKALAAGRMEGGRRRRVRCSVCGAGFWAEMWVRAGGEHPGAQAQGIKPSPCSASCAAQGVRAAPLAWEGAGDPFATALGVLVAS